MTTTESLRFPYMVWAHTESFLSPYCLSQSGMPAPDGTLLGQAPPIDLSPPTAEALPALNARLGELFGVETERLLVTAGASAAMLTLAQRFFRPGSRVVTELPSYEPFRALPELHGAELRIVQRRVEDQFRLPIDQIEAALEDCSPDRPGHIFISNPHNPTGQSLEREELIRLAGIAERAGGLLISNEIYMEFAPTDERVHAFDLAPNAISIGGLTKAYGLGALRIGWLILGTGPAAEHRHLTDHTYLNYVDLPTATLRLAVQALAHLEELLQPVRQFETHCRPHLLRWLKDTPGVTCPPPRYGLAAFPHLDGISDTRELSRYLSREVSVDVVPGEAFGMSGHIRLGFGVPEETLVEGLKRLTGGIEAFRSGAAGPS